MLKKLLSCIRKMVVSAVLSLILISVLFNIAYFAVNLLPQRNHIFSVIASRLLHQPVKIKQSEMEGFLYRPVLVFHDVTVGQIQLHELHITLNVWRSILEKQWVTLQVVVDHLHLQVHQDAGQHFEISGLTDSAITLSQQTPSIAALIGWIGTQSEIIFSKAQVDLYSENGAYLPIENLNMLIRNQDDTHRLSASFYLKQTVPSSLQLVAKIVGNPFQNPHTAATVFMQGQQVNLSQWMTFFQKYVMFHKMATLQGIANFKTWVNYENQNVQSVRSQFVLKNIAYDQMKMHQLSVDALWQRDKISWELQARFNPLGVVQNAMIPGVSGVLGMLRMTPTRGALMLEGKNTQITLPQKLLKAPFVSNLFTKINWVRENQNWRIETEAIKLDNPQWHLYTQFISQVNFQKMQQKPQLQLTGIASLNGNTVNAIHATVADLTHPVVVMQAQMKTDFSKALNLLGESSINAEGPMLCDVKIKWPMNEKNNAMSMQGSIHFLNDRIEFPKWDVPLTHLIGVAAFNDHRFFANHLEAQLFREPLFISIDAHHHLDQLTNMHITLDGSVNPTELSKRMNFPLLNHIHHAIAFNAKMMMPNFNSTLFSSVHVKLGDFYLMDQVWQNLSLDITPLQNGASIQLYNPDISGDIFFPNNKEMPLRAHMHYLSLQYQKNNSNDKVSTLIHPEVIPAMDILIDQLQVNHHSDGRVHLVTEPIQNGLAIREITMDSPFLKFSAKGSWVLQHFQSNTTLIGRASSPDLGAVLSQYHLSSRLKNGKFLSDFSLTWPGTPYQFSLEHVIGKASLSIKKGRILQLDSDTETNLALGRLLNLFSLESISHLISFDFSVFTKKGFSFDVLQGNIELSQGTLFTQEIELDGPLAKVDFKGKMSFTNQLNDLSMAVFPKVSSSLPALIGFAGGPVAGAAAWLANKIISPTVGQLMQMNYHIGGTPNKPIVTRV